MKQKRPPVAEFERKGGSETVPNGSAYFTKS